MSDPVYPPPPPATPPQPPYAAPQPVTGYAPVPSAPPGPAKKKRTGLIITVVVVSLLLLCCCAAVVGAIAFNRLADTSSGDVTTTIVPPTAEEPDPTEKARLAEWQKVLDAFEEHDYTFVEPDERQTRLMEAAIAQLFPDFTAEEFMVEPGSFDASTKTHQFDNYFVRLSLKADPEIQTAYSFDVATPLADERGIPRENLDLDEGDGVLQLEGRTWVLYPTKSKGPLLGGIKNDAFASLMAQAISDFPGGLPTQIFDDGDGRATVSVETWKSFMWSYTFDRVEATYELQDDGWLLLEYKAIVESGEGAAEPSQT